MKKVLFAIIAPLIIFIISSYADSPTSSSPKYFSYTTSGTPLTATITGLSSAWTNAGEPGNISIPSIINGYLVISIGNSAFFYCTNLTSITIPSSVLGIGDFAFGNCTRLTSITLSEFVLGIGDDAFVNCFSLTNITVDNGNQYYSSLNGVLFDVNKHELIQYPCGINGDYTIPSSVTSIGAKAFKNCGGLKNIHIPSSVTNIGEAAFAGCWNLYNVDIPSSVTSIGKGVFYGCTWLNVHIPPSVTSIGSYAFANCSERLSIDIPSSVTNIGDRAFGGCTRLENVYEHAKIPPKIGIDIFTNCGKLHITVPHGCKDNYNSWKYLLNCYIDESYLY